MSAPRPIAVLGSTGSIGRTTLEVVGQMAGRFEIRALAAGANLPLLAEQVERFHPKLVSVREPAFVDTLAGLLRERGQNPLPDIMTGAAGLTAAATEAGAELVVAAVVGVAALRAVEATLRKGVTVALANKEAMVVAGGLLQAAAASGGATLLPIDSEHSAIHQCLRSGKRSEVRRLILTASGGPFLRYSAAELEGVTPSAALRHPTWRMGDRISIDSATLMNKGFEIIEACQLFGCDERAVEVLIHPQSIVHSLVEFRDGSVLAQMGTADMGIPIQYALTWPERLESPRMRLKLEEVGRLEFEPADVRRFPCLRLAREAWQAGGAAPAVLNAADEVAVERFRMGELPFAAIPVVVEQSLQQVHSLPATCLDEVLAADGAARAQAAGLAERHARSAGGRR